MTTLEDSNFKRLESASKVLANEWQDLSARLAELEKQKKEVKKQMAKVNKASFCLHDIIYPDKI